MTSLIGEFDCKVDAKGRFMFPVNLRKQLEEVFDKGIVINRNLHQKCLVLYPINEWNKLNKKLSKLNRLIKANDVFVRKFTGGATAADADNTGRVLLPKPLVEYAGISSDIKVFDSSGMTVYTIIYKSEFAGGNSRRLMCVSTLASASGTMGVPGGVWVVA